MQDAQHKPGKRTRRRIKRRPSLPTVIVRLACGTYITIEQSTEDGHLADLIDAPPGTIIERSPLTLPPPKA